MILLPVAIVSAEYLSKQSKIDNLFSYYLKTNKVLERGFTDKDLKTYEAKPR